MKTDMDKFIFNQYGVCTNPEVYGQINGSMNCIYVAKSEVNGWMFGYRFECDNRENSGASAPSIQHIQKKINSKREAVMEAIKSLKAIAATHSKNGFGVQGIVDCCNKAFEDVNQTRLEF